MSKKRTQEQFLKEAFEIHNDKYQYLSPYVAIRQEILIRCSVCRCEFWQLPEVHLRGSGCKACFVSSRKRTQEQFLKEAFEIHNDKYQYLSPYLTSHQKILIKCNTCQYEFWQLPTAHLGGAGCDRCAREKKNKEQTRTSEEFVNEAISLHGNRYEYPEPYVSITKKIKITCTVCHHEFLQLPSHHLSGRGCPKCGFKKTAQAKLLTMEEFVSRSVSVHGEKYTYPDLYVAAFTKIRIICNTCNTEFMQTPSNHWYGKGCPFCAKHKKRSLGEKLINETLSAMNINFSEEKTFDSCRNEELLRFDFFLPGHNIAIEYNGKQHYVKGRFNGTEKDFLDTQKRDSIKREWCNRNGIILVTIPYTCVDIPGTLKRSLEDNGILSVPN